MKYGVGTAGGQNNCVGGVRFGRYDFTELGVNSINCGSSKRTTPAPPMFSKLCFRSIAFHKRTLLCSGGRVQGTAATVGVTNFSSRCGVSGIILGSIIVSGKCSSSHRVVNLRVIRGLSVVGLHIEWVR